MKKVNNSAVNNIIFGFERSLFMAESSLNNAGEQLCIINEHSVTWVGQAPTQNQLCSCKHKILTTCPMSKTIHHRMRHIFSEICFDRNEYNFAKTVKISIPFLDFAHVGHFILSNIIIYKLKNHLYSAKIVLINHMGIKVEEKLKQVTIHLIQFIAWAQNEPMTNFSANFKSDKVDHFKDIVQSK